MNEGWQSAVEQFPAGWHFPAGDSWLAGWIYAGPNRHVSDLRAWVDGRVFLGLHGLPKPGLDERFLNRPGPPYAGFVVRVAPHRGARLLRLETRDPLGEWREFFRTPITVAEDAAPCPPPPDFAGLLPELLPALLRRHAQRPDRPLAALADELVSAALAEPLNALPVPPFHGALEEPRGTGSLHYGRLALSGWLAHRTARIVRLTALVDAVQETALLHGLPRADIGAVFADLPGREHSQFLGHADLPANAATPVLVKVFAELDDGTKHLVFAQRFTPRIVAEGAVALPPRSRRTFARAAWALRGAAQRHGLPSGARTGLWPLLRAAWTDYAAEAPAKRHAAPLLATERDLLARLGASAPPAARPLRVTVVTHNLNFEGAPWFILELARHLAAQPGWTVRLVSPQDGPLREICARHGLPVQVIDLGAVDAAADVETARATLAAAAGPAVWADTDLVIANTMVSWWAVLAAADAGVPALLYVHESAPVRRFFERLLPLPLHALVQEAFRRATRVVFTAGSTLRVHEALDSARNFLLLPSWVDIARVDTFAAAHSPAELRRRHGLDPDATLVVNIGSVCERKGQHIYLRAVQLLHEELRHTHPGRRIHFLVVGARPGLYLDALRQEARLHGLDEVVFVPETGEIYDFYRLADIFVCTSFEESFPRVLLESAAFRRPIVTTDVNGITEMLAPGDAWFVPPGDRYQLAEALKQALAAHFAGDSARAEAARATVAARYHQERALPLHTLLARHAAGGRPRA